MVKFGQEGRGLHRNGRNVGRPGQDALTTFGSVITPVPKINPFGEMDMRDTRIKGVVVTAAIVAALTTGAIRFYEPAGVHAAAPVAAAAGPVTARGLPDFADLVQRYG